MFAGHDHVLHGAETAHAGVQEGTGATRSVPHSAVLRSEVELGSRLANVSLDTQSLDGQMRGQSEAGTNHGGVRGGVDQVGDPSAAAPTGRTSQRLEQQRLAEFLPDGAQRQPVVAGSSRARRAPAWMASPPSESSRRRACPKPRSAPMPVAVVLPPVEVAVSGPVAPVPVTRLASPVRASEDGHTSMSDVSDEEDVSKDERCFRAAREARYARPVIHGHGTRKDGMIEDWLVKVRVMKDHERGTAGTYDDPKSNLRKWWEKSNPNYLKRLATRPRDPSKRQASNDQYEKRRQVAADRFRRLAQSMRSRERRDYVRGLREKQVFRCISSPLEGCNCPKMVYCDHCPAERRREGEAAAWQLHVRFHASTNIELQPEFAQSVPDSELIALLDEAVAVSDETKEKCLADWEQRLGHSKALCACASCGMRDLNLKYYRLTLSSLPTLFELRPEQQAEREALDHIELVHQDGSQGCRMDLRRIVSCYNHEGTWYHLHPELVDPPTDAQMEPTALFCQFCHDQAILDDVRAEAPKLSIANGLDLGWMARLSELEPLSELEQVLLSEQRLYHVVIKVTLICSSCQNAYLY